MTEEKVAEAQAEEVKAAEAAPAEEKAPESTVTEPVSPLLRSFEFSVPRADIAKLTESELRRRAKTARVDGFRKGHVPMNMIRAMYGQDAEMEALNQLINMLVDKKINEDKIRIAGVPSVEPAEGAAEDGDPKFVAKFEVIPEFDAPDFSKMELKRYTCDVTEKEVADTLTVMRKQRATFKEVERASQKDDEVTVDFEGKIDGVAFEGGSATDFVFSVGNGQMLPEFDAAATGMKKGETKTFKLAFPKDYGKAEIAGKEAEFSVTVKKVAEPVLPELDEAFAKSLGIKGGVAELTAEVEKNLRREVKARLLARTKEGVFSALLDAAKYDLPRVMVEDECGRIAEEFRQNMAARGANVKDMPLDPKLFTSQAERRVRLGLMVSKLIGDNQIKSTPEQVRAFAAEMASAYENPAEVTEWYLKDQNRYAELSAAVIENNLVDFVLGAAKTAEEPIGFSKLMERA